jgi:hypothetical protein
MNGNNLHNSLKGSGPQNVALQKRDSVIKKFQLTGTCVTTFNETNFSKFANHFSVHHYKNGRVCY